VVGSSTSGEGNSTKPVGSCGVSKDVAGTLCCFFWGSLESTGAYHPTVRMRVVMEIIGVTAMTIAPPLVSEDILQPHY
jgi:hypothetical protein